MYFLYIYIYIYVYIYIYIYIYIDRSLCMASEGMQPARPPVQLPIRSDSNPGRSGAIETDAFQGLKAIFERGQNPRGRRLHCPSPDWLLEEGRGLFRRGRANPRRCAQGVFYQLDESRDGRPGCELINNQH